MGLIIMIFLIEMLISLFLRMIFPNIDLIILSAIYISINSILIFMKSYRYKNQNWIFEGLILGYLLRVCLLIVDIYGRKYITLPNSGADSEHYYLKTVRIGEDLGLIQQYTGDVYSEIMGVISYFFGEERMILQYVNVLLGFCTIVIVYKILKELKVEKSIISIVVFILSVLPNSAILSSIYLRESCITFFVTCSFYYFVKWFSRGGLREFSLAIILILIGMSLHAGVVGVLLGYFISIIIYNPRIKRITIGIKSIINLIFVLGIFMVINTFLGDSVFDKFTNIENISDIGNHLDNYSIGGSEYLSNLVPSNIIEMILFLPIRALYFIASPMPWDVRGINDIIALIFSSSYYILAFILASRSFKRDIKYKEFLICVFYILISTISIFAYGTSNAGSALRHRDKLVGIITIILAIGLDSKFIKNRRIQDERDSKENLR